MPTSIQCTAYCAQNQNNNSQAITYSEIFSQIQQRSNLFAANSLLLSLDIICRKRLFLLTYLFDLHGQHSKIPRITFSDIAFKTRLSPSFAHRVLKDFEKLGIIALLKKEIKILVLPPSKLNFQIIES